MELPGKPAAFVPRGGTRGGVGERERKLWTTSTQRKKNGDVGTKGGVG